MSKYDVEFEVRWDDIRQADEGSLWVTLTNDRLRLDGWKRDDENDPCERHHCDDRDAHGCICGELAEPYIEALRKWHNDAHEDTFSWCDQSPCSDFREVAREV